MSSVTYMTGRPSRTAKVMASSVSLRSWSMPHPSAYCRSGLEPMNAPHSIGMPTRCEISAIGLMSATSVRAAQLAATRRRCVGDLPRQPLDVLHDVRPGAGQADVGRVDPQRIDEVQDPQLLLDRRTSSPTATAGHRAASRRRAGRSAASGWRSRSSRGSGGAWRGTSPLVRLLVLRLMRRMVTSPARKSRQAQSVDSQAASRTAASSAPVRSTHGPSPA